ncbi:hypothetical protein BDV06DRAFT_183899 [Aspergillus oleicola]
MKHIRGLLSTAQALRHTFVIPRTQALPRPQFLRYSPVQSSSQLRFRWTKPEPQLAPDAEVKDDLINSDYVRIVNENNKLEEPQRLRELLDGLDRKTYFVLQVAPPDGALPPICKIVNRHEHYRRAKEHAKALKAARITRASVKQIELNWVIDDHDLSHRLGKMKSFLEKGRQVEVILLRRNHRQTPPPQQVKALMEKVQQAFSEVGASQQAPVEGEPGRRLMYTVKKTSS